MPITELMACGRCRLRLNTFTDFDNGTVSHIHARPELDWDHPAEPVPVDSIQSIVICDFCQGPNPISDFVAESFIIRAPDGQPRAFTGNWAACRPCAALVDTRDLAGLVERVRYANLERQGFARELADIPEQREHDEKWFPRLFNKLFPLITKRVALLTEPPSMDDIPPSRLPKVRDRLVRMWGDPDIARGYQGQSVKMLPGVDVGDEDVFVSTVAVNDLANLTRFCRRMEVGTQVADLFWISEKFTRLAIGAGKKLEDCTITRDELPAANGLMVWKSSIDTVERGGWTADVFGIGWTLIPGGIWITLYARADQFFDPERFGGIQQLRESIGWLFPINPGAGVPLNASVSAPETSQAGSLLATVLATWHLMRQAGVSEQFDQLPDKATRKAYARTKRPMPTVRVVDLRKRAPRTPTPGEMPGQRAGWSYRVMVGGETGGFWRTYWTGPGRTVRERRFIEPYLTGTTDMPLKEDVQTVKALR